MNSLWTATADSPRFDGLKEDLKTEVLIIGGGLTGLLCAYALDRAGVKYALVEAERICGGITKNTTAKITSQHGLLYHQLIKKFGVDVARGYLEANESALKTYRKLCKNLDCSLEEKDAFVYSTDNLKAVEKEYAALEKIGASAQFISTLPLPFPVAAAIKFRHQAQFHPLKFAYAISRGLNIYENTKVLELKDSEAVTNGGKITAEKIIVATHFPFLNTHGFYFLKMFQHRSYVLALKGAPEVKGMYLDENEKGFSFREHGEFLLLGGGSYRTGEKGGNWRVLEAFAREHYPHAETAYRWATQDCMTLDGVPYIGRYSGRTPNLFVATGFNKWGMTSAMVGSELLTDLILGRENPYEKIFSPSRTMFRKQLFVNVAKTAVNFLTPTVPRCPHLGCALKYNPQERSWDCPCHGSRFTEEKKLIDNPATKDMK